jgi:hypothetical protein
MTPIGKKYRELGGENGFLGKPISQETICSDGQGWYRIYEHGQILYLKGIGAHEVHGAILSKYLAWEREEGVLGYPVSDETELDGGLRYNRFQKGLIVWSTELNAHGICEDGVHMDYLVDFERLAEAPWYAEERAAQAVADPDAVINPQWTPYGDLNEFYHFIRDAYCIDLKYNIDTNTYERKYVGWQVADFRNGNNTLNGCRLRKGERLIITVAQMLLLRWHLRRLKDHKQARINEINRYFHKGHCFKRDKIGKRWKYNKWCSEFASYVFQKANMPVSLGKKQSFVCEGLWKYKKIGWCMSAVPYFVSYYKNINRYRRISEYIEHKLSPHLGHYLCTWNGKSVASGKLKGHSMLVLGFEENKEDFSTSRIYVVNGNVGENATENRVAKVEWKSISNGFHGVGIVYASVPMDVGGPVHMPPECIFEALFTRSV